MAVLVYRIHPAVGIARVGDSDQYYLAPETDAAVHENPTGHSQTPASGRLYRDNTGPPGKILRQAARFRIYEFTYASAAALAPTRVREVTTADFDILWTVELANRKSRPVGQIGTNLPRIFTDAVSKSLPADSAQKEVMERALPGATPSKIEWATLRIADQGRLLVVPGAGATGHLWPDDASARKAPFVIMPGWWDDTADGPVRAEIRRKGVTGPALPVVPAWIVIAPPAYGGPVRHVVTLYDWLFDIYWNDKKLGDVPRRGFKKKQATFRADLQPVLHRTSLSSWVSRYAMSAHGPGRAADFEDPVRLKTLGATRDKSADAARKLVFERLKLPYALRSGPGALTPTAARNMPPEELPPVSPFQYRAFESWAQDPKFALDWTAAAPKPTHALDVPAELTRAHLLAAAGGKFGPGVEVGDPASDPATWSLAPPPGLKHASWDDAFRLDHEKIPPGELTFGMSIPWQVDMLTFCDGGPNSALANTQIPYWPGARPLEVTRDDGTSGPWGLSATPRGSVTGSDALDNWTKLGFVRKVLVDGKVEYQEHERIAPRLP